MDVIEPYVYLNRITVQDNKALYTYLESLIKNNTNIDEGFYDLDISYNLSVIQYYKIINSLDFSFDSENKKVISEEISKAIKSEIRFDLKNETMLIWGRPKIISSINKILQGPKPFKIQKLTIDFKTLYNQLPSVNLRIKEISFKDINIKNKYIPLVKLTTVSNEDALDLISSIGTHLISSKIELFSFHDSSVDLDINLVDGIIHIQQLNNIRNTFMEEVKEIINNLQL